MKAMVTGFLESISKVIAAQGFFSDSLIVLFLDTEV